MILKGIKKKSNIECDTCGKEFYKKPCRIQRSKNHYCSIKCKDIGWKLSDFIVKTCTQCNKNFNRKRHYRPKNKNLSFCSSNCSNLYNGKFNQGTNHFNYNPELTDNDRIYKRDTYENIKWRRLVFKRDNYTCKLCNKNKTFLNAHHLDNYASNKEKRCDLNNGITLCKECHYLFHNTYGYRDNNKSQFEEFKSSCII